MLNIDASLSDEQFRKKYISDILPTNEKMKMYNSVINGDLELFKSYIFGTPQRQPYNIFEELSQKGLGWTAFHYAMHYGKINMIEFIIEYLISQNILSIALRLKSKDGRCPLLCLLKSNALKADIKRDTFEKIITNFTIPVSGEVIKELKNRKYDDLIPKIRPYD